MLLIVIYNVQSAAAVARDPEARASVRQQFFGKIADLMSHTRSELYWFGGVSLTAGFCEEFLYRGYFIWALASWLGWWGAAALSVLLFASGHTYQGWNGVLRTGVVGTFFTLVVAILNSLWPAIVLHAHGSRRRSDGVASAARGAGHKCRLTRGCGRLALN